MPREWLGQTDLVTTLGLLTMKSGMGLSHRTELKTCTLKITRVNIFLFLRERSLHPEKLNTKERKKKR